MNKDYPSYDEIGNDISDRRQQIKCILEDHNIFKWPREEDFAAWLENESRISAEGKKDAIQLAEEVLELKALMSKIFLSKAKKKN